jgi:hypothetical protein
MDDLLGYHFPSQRLQGTLNAKINRLAKLLLEIAPDAKEIPQGLLFGHDLYGNVDIGILASLSPGITAEEADAYNSKTLRHFILMRLQKRNDIVSIADHAAAP